MNLLERTQLSDGSTEFRSTKLYYLLQYAIVGLVIVGLTMPKDESGTISMWLWVPFIGVVALRLAGLRGSQREIAQAMREREVQVSGSRWNPSNPLRYRIPADAPMAKPTP